MSDLDEKSRKELADALAGIQYWMLKVDVAPDGSNQLHDAIDTVALHLLPWAMAALVIRLCEEDYVRPARRKELVERAVNMREGLGFVTCDELKAEAAQEDADDDERWAEELFE